MSCSSFCLKCSIGESGLKFCLYAEFFIGERAKNIRCISVNVCDLTHIYVNLKVIGPEGISIPICFRCVTVNDDVCIIVDHTDRERCNCCRTCLIVCSGASNYNCCCVVFFINGIFSTEACCKFHMIKLEVVTVVKVDNCFYGLDRFDIGCIYIHPIYGTAVEAVKSSICGNYFYSRSINAGSYFNKSDNNSLIAHVIADFELNAVNTVCNSDIGNIDSAVREGCVNLNTVNISLCGSGIKPCCICLFCVFCNGCGNSNEIIG